MTSVDLTCVATWLQKWQTLAGATVASIVASTAAYVAFRNTSRSLRHTERLEERRRSRKHAALRAVLPLALAQVMDYAERSARALDQLVQKCVGDTLPPMTAPANFAQPLPSDTLKTLADFIEYSDNVDVRIVEDTVAWIQIHDSRIRTLVEHNRGPSGLRLVLKTGIMGYIIDAASIYAGAAAVFRYARRQEEKLPRTVSWEPVRDTLMSIMKVWNDQYQSLMASRESRATGPFDKLRE